MGAGATTDLPRPARTSSRPLSRSRSPMSTPPTISFLSCPSVSACRDATSLARWSPPAAAPCARPATPRLGRTVPSVPQPRSRIVRRRSTSARLRLRELAVAVLASDLPYVRQGRHLPLGVGTEAGDVLDAQLAGLVRDDLGGHVQRVGKEGAQEPDRAQLEREAQPVVRSTSLPDQLGSVRKRSFSSHHRQPTAPPTCGW
jgi:hypothetical protein